MIWLGADEGTSDGTAEGVSLGEERFEAFRFFGFFVGKGVGGAVGAELSLGGAEGKKEVLDFLPTLSSRGVCLPLTRRPDTVEISAMKRTMATRIYLEERSIMMN